MNARRTAVSLLSFFTLLIACSSDDDADPCSSATCTNLGTKTVSKSQQFCGETGSSAGVSGDAETWVWDGTSGKCTCQIQLNQLYWKSCSFGAK
jgi:hypothetical protein